MIDSVGLYLAENFTESSFDFKFLGEKLQALLPLFNTAIKRRYKELHLLKYGYVLWKLKTQH